MLKDSNFIITNKTNGKLISLPFSAMKDHILGKDYSLSLVIVGKKAIQNLNSKYRNINTPTDILSFSVDKNIGEIFICQEIAKKKAPTFDRSYKNFLSYLFIHGCVHLLGFDHGTKMEKIEEMHRNHFQI